MSLTLRLLIPILYTSITTKIIYSSFSSDITINATTIKSLF